jgi:hypothetical protein
MPKRTRKRPVRKAVSRARSAKSSPKAPRRRSSPRKPAVSPPRARLTPLNKSRVLHLDDGEPRRERTEPEGLIPGAAEDDLAEELGEEFVESAVSGEEVTPEINDEVVPEEEGGPFIETSGRTEFAHDTDASNPPDAEPAPFPTASPVRRGAKPRV